MSTFNEDLGKHGARDGFDDGYDYDAPSPLTLEEHSAISVRDFHQKSDVDVSQQSQHHTLGVKRDQASPGDHVHDGIRSKVIPNIPALEAAVAALQASVAALGTWTTFITNANAGSYWHGSGSDPAINNGTILGKYCLIGKLCFVRIKIVFGSTTTQGTGYWFWNTPFNATSAGGEFSGSISSYAGTALAGSVIHIGTNQVALINQGNANFWGVGNPAAFGTGNTLVFDYFYELP